MSLLVVDGNSIANRAFFGIKVLTTKEGQYTNAIYGFMNILLSLTQNYQPDEVAIAFDLPAPTFRHKMYDGYKANRHGMPDELAAQMPLLRQLLTDLGYKLVTAEGWEADDILGTLAAACDKRRETCYLATGDRDNLQLVSPHTTVLLATTSRGHSETRVMDQAAVQEKYGLAPRQLIDVKSLQGDTSDNIPGVKGIGEKTALALIQQFGSLAGVYEHLDDPSIKPRQRANLEEYKADAELSYTLGTIRTDAPVETAPGTYRPGEGNKAAAVRLLLDLEIRALIPRLGLEHVLPAESEPEPAAPLPQAQVGPLPDAPAGLWLLAARPPVYGKKGNRIVIDRPAHWYAVQDRLVCPLEDADLPRLLDDPALRLEVFDAAPLYAASMQAGGWGSSIAWDGKLAAYLLDASAAKYSIAALVEAYKVKPAFACEDWPDAPFLAGLFARMKEEITALGEDFLYNEIEFPLAQVLADMTRTGVLVDRAGIEQFGAGLRQQIEAKLTYIRSQVEDPDFNPNSPKQLGEMLFVRMKLPHGRKTSRGWSTDNATLQKLRPDCPLVDDILQYRSYLKLYSTYAEGLLKVIGPDGRIHSTFNQTEARTGRLSSDNPNLQNIPIRTELGSQLRGFFIAKPGCVFVDADYSQIELRVLAHIADDAHMQAAFSSGEDIHAVTASQVFRVPLSEVTPEMRRNAKAVNFGIVYGISAWSLSQDIGVSPEEAKAYMDAYLENYSGVRAYMKDIVETAKAQGYVTTLYGRRRYLPELKSSNFNLRAFGERVALNTPIQGTAADIIKLAMIRVDHALAEAGLQAKLILQVHDELIVECPQEEAAQASRILQREMEQVAQLKVPLVVEAKAGGSWYEAK